MRQLDFILPRVVASSSDPGRIPGIRRRFGSSSVSEIIAPQKCGSKPFLLAINRSRHGSWEGAFEWMQLDQTTRS
jgi:hypothetical protein